VKRERHNQNKKHSIRDCGHACEHARHTARTQELAQRACADRDRRGSSYDKKRIFIVTSSLRASPHLPPMLG